ncbi:HAMP domain-containing sensor histidine kinase [Fodinicola feengrottensis]|uniref:histidine kinase n=1 Tax=Fodinicola feengrottensis TaxID=435914 RepID=A0ABP4RWL8_9ACTN
MRSRLLAAVLVLALVVSTALAVPLALMIASARTASFAAQRQHDLAWFVTLALDHSPGGIRRVTTEMARYTAVYGDGLVLVDSRGDQLAATGSGSLTRPAIAAAAANALRSQQIAAPPLLLPWSRGTVVFALPVGGPTTVSGAVVLDANVRLAAADLAVSWGVVGAGLAAVALSFALLALGLTRWLLQPLRELQAATQALAAGTGDVRVAGRSGPPEIRELGARFNGLCEALAQAAQQQRDLVADASHQLRNPMAALRLRLDAAATDPGSIRKNRLALGAAATELSRLEQLLDGLLQLARADSFAVGTATSAQAAEIRCTGWWVLSERVDAWRPTACRSQITLCADENSWSGEVAISELDLGQMLDVFLDNAIRYAGRSAEVRTSIQRHGSTGRFVLCDNGTGLPANELAAATRRFWRSARTSAQPGSGLGLAIADQLARAHHGRVSLRHTDPAGLTVVLELPIARAQGK